MDKTMNVCLKKLDENAVLPTYATADSAGADLYALASESIPPKETRLIHTGIALQIPQGYAGFIYARSGLATKKGLAPANKVGVIDADYRGEIMVALYNQSAEERMVEAGERIAQLVIAPVVQAAFVPVDSLEDTARAEGGFGSTGKR